MVYAARISFLLAAAVLVSSCKGEAHKQGEEHESFAATYDGDPYLGRVTVSIRPPGWTTSDSNYEYGTSTAAFTDLHGGKVRFVLMGNIASKGDAGFAADGLQNADGWSTGDGDVVLTIDKDGNISGGGKAPPNKFRFSGLLEPDRIQLDVDLELLEAGQGGMPAGTHFLFEYRLHRTLSQIASATRTEDAADSEGDCKRVEYHLKSVPNLFGGAMGMVSVPECIK